MKNRVGRPPQKKSNTMRRKESANRIKKYMKDNNLTVRGFSDILRSRYSQYGCKIASNTIQRWRSGEVEMSSKYAEILESYTGICKEYWTGAASEPVPVEKSIKFAEREDELRDAQTQIKKKYEEKIKSYKSWFSFLGYNYVSLVDTHIIHEMATVIDNADFIFIREKPLHRLINMNNSHSVEFTNNQFMKLFEKINQDIEESIK